MYWNGYLTYSIEQSACWEANRSQSVKKFPPFYGTRRFINAFTEAHHLGLSWARSIQPTLSSHSLKLNLLIILPPTPGSSKWFLSLRFPYQDPLYTSPLLVHATCPVHLILLDFIKRTIFGEWYRSLSSPLCFFYSPVISSILGRNTLPSTLFSKTPSLCSSLNVSDQVMETMDTIKQTANISIHPYLL